MVPVHDYEERYMEVYAMMKIWTFKHEPLFPLGAEGGVWSI